MASGSGHPNGYLQRPPSGRALDGQPQLTSRLGASECDALRPKGIGAGALFPLADISGKIVKIFSVILVDGTRLATSVLALVILGNCGACNE